MGGYETVIAVGVGCRKGCAEAEIVALVRDTLSLLATHHDEPVALFTIAAKRGEPGLAAAAAKLGTPLAFLDRAELATVAHLAVSRSRFVEQAVGVPSVAETAALAGAGAGAVLLIARRATRAATCALAGPPHLRVPA